MTMDATQAEQQRFLSLKFLIPQAYEQSHIVGLL